MVADHRHDISGTNNTGPDGSGNYLWRITNGYTSGLAVVLGNSVGSINNLSSRKGHETTPVWIAYYVCMQY